MIFAEVRNPPGVANAVSAVQYHWSPTPDGDYRRLPMPWAALVLTLGAGAIHRTRKGAWTAFPKIALRGPAATWSLGRDAAAGPMEYAVALIEPWAIEPLFGMPASDAAGAIVDVAELWRPDAGLLLEQVRAAPTPAAKIGAIVRALQARLRNGFAADAAALCFARDCRALSGAVNVAQAARQSQCSDRWFRTRILRSLGMTPKQWASVERFSANLRRLHANPWRTVGAAAAPDYFDQSHEIREFRAMAGMTPGQYRALKAGGDRRVFVTPAA